MPINQWVNDLVLKEDETIRSMVEYFKHEYCNDHIGNKQYLQYLEFLHGCSKDHITKSKIESMMFEVKESIKREG